MLVAVRRSYSQARLNWPQAWIVQAKSSLRTYFNRWYLQPTQPRPPESNPQAQAAAQQQPQHRKHGERNDIIEWMNSQLNSGRIEQTGDELEQYYSLGVQEAGDVVRWWLDRSTTFPGLSKLALDIWAIPAMASECERTFSAAKLTITSQRNSLTIETLEKFQCLKQWMGHMLVGLGGILAKKSY